VKLLVRVCQCTYNEKPLQEAGIEVAEFFFEDGQLPSKEIIEQWLAKVDDFFEGGHNSTSSSVGANFDDVRCDSDDEKRIAVHCVAGLGRAPLMVALAMIDHGCSPLNAIRLIREHRGGAINQK